MNGGELPELCADALSAVRHRSGFAVAEIVQEGERVLFLTDDQVEATELAEELRRRGVKAGAYRTGR